MRIGDARRARPDERALRQSLHRNIEMMHAGANGWAEPAAASTGMKKEKE